MGASLPTCPSLEGTCWLSLPRPPKPGLLGLGPTAVGTSVTAKGLAYVPQGMGWHQCHTALPG